MFVYLDDEDGHLLNNTKWFSNTRINNKSELSEFVRTVASGSETTFFYNPPAGMCHCISLTSQMPHHQVTDIYRGISKLVSQPLKHPDPDTIKYIEPANPIPDPLAYESAESYQAAIRTLADEYQHSFFRYGLYAFRTLDVPDTNVYLHAAMRDYTVKQLAKTITAIPEALAIVARIEGNESIFGTRERIQRPDETLYFNTGSDRDKALLLYTLLRQSPFTDENCTIELSGAISHVIYGAKSVAVGESFTFEGDYSQ